MQTEAIFTQINKRIKQEIIQAEHTIYVAVAWFTDYILFNELEKKANSGCKVYVITSDDFINKQSKIDYDYYQSENFQIYLFGDSKKDLIHHKFCVIDEKTVISGSYNWTHKAKSNSENIVITKDDKILSEQFINEFQKLLKHFNTTSELIDYKTELDKIIKRLEIIKNFILIEETDLIKSVSESLVRYSGTKVLQSINNHLRKRNYSAAIAEIQVFIQEHKNDKVILWVDEELTALKLELKNLEIQLNAFNNEKIELEKEILDFQHRHYLELGTIISSILKLRKFRFKDNKTKFDEAEKDEKQYNQEVNENKNKIHFELSIEERKELKFTFRKASILCHPDKVNDEMKAEAEQTFIELRRAYDNNDLEKVKHILNSLEHNSFFKSKSESVTKNEKLKLAIQKIQIQIKNVLYEIYEVKDNETYKTISLITDWDEYFNDLKKDLIQELETLETEFENGEITTANN
jgi:hypothetical protein